jgi:hypothetical protein
VRKRGDGRSTMSLAALLDELAGLSAPARG